MKNIVFAGTPELAKNILAYLLENEFKIRAVLTQPDKPKGRGRKILATPVKRLALEHNIEILQPTSLKAESAQQQLHDLQPDILIVAAYGLILPKTVLDIPKYGCINVHVSLLPSYRGAAPIQNAILNGDKTTGVTIMQMDAGLDTGDILHRKEITIAEHDNAFTLEQKIVEHAGPCLMQTLKEIESGVTKPLKQDDELASYAHKIKKEDAHINWQQPAENIFNMIRAYNPHPIAYTFLNNLRIKIYATKVLADTPTNLEPGTIIDANAYGIYVACEDCVLQITELQAPGKKVLSAKDFVNGHKNILKAGSSFEYTTWPLS